MDRCKGLTVVSHEDLLLAVDNWLSAKKSYENLCVAASEYADYTWQSLPFYKRFYFKVKSGIFKPEEWWLFYRDYNKEHKTAYQCKIGQYLSVFYNNKIGAADSCRRHSLCSGKHYLNEEQVLFVSIFKDLEINNG